MSDHAAPLPSHCSGPSELQAIGARLGTGPHVLVLPPRAKSLRQQLRKNARTKGFLGLNKIKGWRARCASPHPPAGPPGRPRMPSSCPHRAQACTVREPGSWEGRGMLEDVLQQQR